MPSNNDRGSSHSRFPAKRGGSIDPLHQAAAPHAGGTEGTPSWKKDVSNHHINAAPQQQQGDHVSDAPEPRQMQQQSGSQSPHIGWGRRRKPRDEIAEL